MKPLCTSLVIGLLALTLVGCDPTATEAYEEYRSMAPLACKDYCEERVSCEWRGYPEITTGEETTLEQDAFSVAVRECTALCTGVSVEGAHVYRWTTGVSGESLGYFDDLIPGDELIDGFACLYESGSYRCVNGVHQLQPPVLSLCDYASECIAAFEIDYSLHWVVDPSGIGGSCQRSGAQFINAFFFDPL